MIRPRAALSLVLVLFCPWITPVLAQRIEQAPHEQQPSKTLPLPGEVFSVEGRTAFVIPPGPERRAAGMPWVWYAPILPGLPGAEEAWMFQKFRDAGVAVAGIDVGESYGSPDGRALFTALYGELVDRRGFSKRPCLLARSRGGLMLYNRPHRLDPPLRRRFG